MTQADPLEDALAELVASGPVEIHENGQWLAGLSALRYEVQRQGANTLIHLWSEERNLVRRVLRVAEQSGHRIVLEVQRFGRSKPDTLEFLSSERNRSDNQLTREKFRARFRQLLAAQFPDEQIEALSTSSDLEHSLSGCYTRGVLRRGQRAWAVIAAATSEDAFTLDAILTFGLIWLHRVREHARTGVVSGLRVFLPADSSRVTAHRLSALDASINVELYEIHEARWRAQRIDARDVGNLAIRLTPRREVELTLAQARPLLDPWINKLHGLAPDAIEASVPPGTRDVALRFRGLEFARWRRGKITFGLGDAHDELTENRPQALEHLIGQLTTYRHPAAPDATHPLYRMQPERWLESLVQVEPSRIDARLDLRHIYAQVPAFAAADRGVIDLLGVTQDGRLAVIELKASEDIHLALQAVDYWLRVRWHQRQDDFHSYGYFAGVELQEKPPLLYLVAPTFRFHPATDVILRCISRDLEIMRVGLNENWRRGLRVLLRQ